MKTFYKVLAVEQMKNLKIYSLDDLELQGDSKIEDAWRYKFT